MHKIAQVPHEPGNPINGLGNFDVTNPTATLESIISSVVGILTVIGGLWFIFVVITGALAYINAGGDKGALEEARKKIITGLLGFTILIAAIFLVDLVGYLLGFDILNLSDTLTGILG